MPAKSAMKKPPSDRVPASSRELEQFRRIFEAIPDIIYKIDDRGYFTYMSESIRELGYTPEELLGRHFSDIVHPHDLQSVSRDAVLPGYKGRKTGDDASPKLFDERRSGRRGTKRLLVRLLPKYLKAHVTAVKEDPDRQYYGEVVSFGNYIGEILQRPPAGRRLRADYSGVVYGEVSANGHYHRPSKSQDKKFEGTVGIIRNVTDRILLEQQKAHLEEELQHALKMESVGQLAGGVSHDLNNVLANILGYAEIIKSGNIDRKLAPIDEELDHRIGLIIAATRSGIDLLRSLLMFARKTQTQRSVLDIHQALTEVHQFLSYTMGRRIRLNLLTSAEHAYVLADPGQIQNILINIALNARDAMPDGGSLSLSTENVEVRHAMKLPAGQTAVPGRYVLISVADTGSGIDPGIVEKIFEPFFTTKPEGKGTGLGLANVLRIAKAHSGFVDVATFPGKGTTFLVYLPVAFRPGTAQPSDVRGAELEPQSIHSHARVLAIDDDASVCDIMRIALENVGCTVTVQTNPQDAIEAYRRHPGDFDVVLIDMLMPELNGFECLRALREVNPKVRALLVTGLSEEIEPERLAEKGFIEAVRKPFNIRHLALRVAQAAQQAERE